MVPSKSKIPIEGPRLELKQFDFPPRPEPPPDDIGRRLLWAALVSIVVNGVLWWQASGFVRNHVIAPPASIEVTLLPPPKKPAVKKVVHKVVKPKLKPPKPLPKPKPLLKPPPVQHHPPRKPPPVQHSHVMATASHGPAEPHGFIVRPGGTAQVGKPVEHQGTVDTTPKPAPPEPKPEPVPQPEPKPEPAPEPPAPKPEPPTPAGPTQDAQPSNQAYPEIPDELKTGDYKSYVRVKVEVHADGSFDVSLRTSSGNVDIDQRVLDALKRWHWKPALKNGDPIDSTQYFKFEFEVQ